MGAASGSWSRLGTHGRSFRQCLGLPARLRERLRGGIVYIAPFCPTRSKGRAFEFTLDVCVACCRVTCAGEGHLDCCTAISGDALSTMSHEHCELLRRYRKNRTCQGAYPEPGLGSVFLSCFVVRCQPLGGIMSQSGCHPAAAYKL